MTSCAVDRLLLVLRRIRLVLENTLVHPMRHRGDSRCWIPRHAREPTVGQPTNARPAQSNCVHPSWLIDNDRDADGMQVIADLHGGDLEDASAKAEFQEIKDRVNFDVCGRSRRGHCGPLTPHSGRLVRRDPTRSCGRGTNVEFYWPCPPKHLLNW